MSAVAEKHPQEVFDETKDRRYFAELVIELEHRVDVNSIKAGELHLWPLLRWQLSRGIKGIESESASWRRQKVKERLASIADGPLGIRRKIARAFKALGGMAVRSGQRRKEAAFQADIEAQFQRLSSLGRVDYAVMSKAELYYQRDGDRRYAPITDPVYEDLRSRGRAVAFAQEPLNFECVHPPISFDVEPYMWLTRGEPTPIIPDVQSRIDQINGVLQQISPKYHLDSAAFFRRYYRYVRKEKYFRRLLKTMKPGFVFLSSFTGWAPLIWAARNLGIPTIDIQHGGQGPYHYLTTHWTCVPASGYELLPDYFWCWSETNRGYVTPWLPGGASRHVPLVGGNRTVARWMRQGESLLSADERAYLERLKRSEKVVLVTLGYSVEDVLPQSIIDAARRTPRWTWLVRLHPLHRGSSVERDVRQRLTSAGAANCEVGMATSIRLQALLSIADHHVTPFSTTGREALAFGVPTVIVHPIGKTYFADEIDMGLFHYTETSQGIVDLLGERSIRSPDARYVATDDSLVDTLLHTLHHDRAAVVGRQL